MVGGVCVTGALRHDFAKYDTAELSAMQGLFDTSMLLFPDCTDAGKDSQLCNMSVSGYTRPKYCHASQTDYKVFL